MRRREIVSSEQTWLFDHQDRFVRSWISPDVQSSAGRPDLVLAVIHGLGDHSGRFDDLGRWFASRGVRVYSFDQRGHGNTPGPPMRIPSYESLLNDVEIFVTRLQAMHPDASVGCLGQSMGGNLVLNHQLRGYTKLEWIVAGSPMLRAVRQPGPISMRLLRLLSAVVPDYVLETPVDPTDLSRDPAMQRSFVEDPLVQQSISLRLGKALIDSGRWAIDHAGKLSTPTLIAHGEADRITCHRASMEFVERSQGRAHLQLWPAGPHDLHHDMLREDYVQSVFDWIVAEVSDHSGDP